jgi:hypothetical protein
LVKDDFDFLFRSVKGEGPPKFYALEVDRYYFFPTPDEEFSMRRIYYAHDEILNDNVENKWLKHLPYLLIGMAGQRLASATRDAQAELCRRHRSLLPARQHLPHCLLVL